MRHQEGLQGGWEEYMCVCVCEYVCELKGGLLKSTNLKTVTLGLDKCNCWTVCRGLLITGSQSTQQVGAHGIESEGLLTVGP